MKPIKTSNKRSLLHSSYEILLHPDGDEAEGRMMPEGILEVTALKMHQWN